MTHDDRILPKPGWWLRRKLNRALVLFSRVLELNPENWSAMWLVGKVHQRFHDRATAFTWFERAYQVNPSQPDVAREASLCAMDLGRHGAAIVFAHRAVQIEPGNAGLHCNLALAYLLAGNILESQKAIAQALARDPADTISQDIQKILRHFTATSGTPPKTTPEESRLQSDDLWLRREADPR